MVPVRPTGVPQHGVPGQRPQLHMQSDMQQHIRGVEDVESGVLRLQRQQTSPVTAAVECCPHRRSRRMVPVRPAGVPQHGMPGQRPQLHMQGDLQQHILGIEDLESGVLRLQRQQTSPVTAAVERCPPGPGAFLVPLRSEGVPQRGVPGHRMKSSKCSALTLHAVATTDLRRGLFVGFGA